MVACARGRRALRLCLLRRAMGDRRGAEEPCGASAHRAHARPHPGGIRTILDVGAGDGALANELAPRFDVTAVDVSPVALSRVRCRTLVASADALPLPDSAFELGLACELLEHLPPRALAGAARELSRVSAEWILVSVPHAEALSRRRLRCPACQEAFHVDGHVASLDAQALDALFPAFRRVETVELGPLQPVTFRRVEILREALGLEASVWAGASRVCPRCGARGFEALRQPAAIRAAGRALDGATKALALALGRGQKPYWLIALYRRKAGK